MDVLEKIRAQRKVDPDGFFCNSWPTGRVILEHILEATRNPIKRWAVLAVIGLGDALHEKFCTKN